MVDDRELRSIAHAAAGLAAFLQGYGTYGEDRPLPEWARGVAIARAKEIEARLRGTPEVARQYHDEAERIAREQTCRRIAERGA